MEIYFWFKQRPKETKKKKLKLLHVYPPDIMLLKNPVLSWTETLALRD